MPSFARLACWVLGIGAVAWGSWLAPSFREDSLLHHIASEYLLGRGLSTQIPLGETPSTTSIAQSSFCNPVKLRDAVVIRLAVINEGRSRPARAGLDTDYTALGETARRSLSCAPFDSFSWLTLFWLDYAKRGIDTQNLGYLRLSYAWGRNEGWLAVWRNRLAIKAFAQLPPDLASEALSEFVRLVDAGYLPTELAESFASAAPAVQARLIDHLKFAKSFQRNVFAQTLYDRGFDVTIPGVEKPTRPWQ
jgi:hypothetical protein